MESLSPPGLSRHTRRSLLVSLAGAALATKALAWKSENAAENVRRFMTPECEIKMSVEYFANAAADSFRFRDSLTNRAFCLSPNGEENRACQARFAGSLAIAHYHFRSRSHAQMPINLRERVLTIDHDDRISARPPFERVLTLEEETASDIQAFGYNPDDPQVFASDTKPVAVWRLLRQNLYLNDQTDAFLIVHWKHTLDFISLVDVIPGDGTELISK